MYILKIDYTATEHNPSFKGNHDIWYEGKGGETLTKNEFPNKYLVNTYGYKTIGAAKHGLKVAEKHAERETRDGYWIVKASIVDADKGE